MGYGLSAMYGNQRTAADKRNARMIASLESTQHVDDVDLHFILDHTGTNAEVSQAFKNFLFKAKIIMVNEFAERAQEQRRQAEILDARKRQEEQAAIEFNEKYTELTAMIRQKRLRSSKVPTHLERQLGYGLRYGTIRKTIFGHLKL